MSRQSIIWRLGAPKVRPILREREVVVGTFGQVVRSLEERLFVGRQAELGAFRFQLGERSPSILNVSGPGGVGKSALLAAFRREAEALGRPVRLADARTFRPTPGDMLGVLGGETLEDVVAAINRETPLLLIDSAEQLAPLFRFLLDTFLPRLDARVRIAIAGRHPLPRLWDRDDAWHRLVRPLPPSSPRRFPNTRRSSTASGSIISPKAPPTGGGMSVR